MRSLRHSYRNQKSKRNSAYSDRNKFVRNIWNDSDIYENEFVNNNRNGSRLTNNSSSGKQRYRRKRQGKINNFSQGNPNRNRWRELVNLNARDDRAYADFYNDSFRYRRGDEIFLDSGKRTTNTSAIKKRNRRDDPGRAEKERSGTIYYDRESEGSEGWFRKGGNRLVSDWDDDFEVEERTFHGDYRYGYPGNYGSDKYNSQGNYRDDEDWRERDERAYMYNGSDNYTGRRARGNIWRNPAQDIRSSRTRRGRSLE